MEKQSASTKIAKLWILQSKHSRFEVPARQELLAQLTSAFIVLSFCLQTNRSLKKLKLQGDFGWMIQLAAEDRKKLLEDLMSALEVPMTMNLFFNFFSLFHWFFVAFLLLAVFEESLGGIHVDNCWKGICRMGSFPSESRGHLFEGLLRLFLLLCWFLRIVSSCIVRTTQWLGSLMLYLTQV